MEHVETGQDVDQGGLLDGEDVFVHPDDLAAGGDSSDPPDHVPLDGEDPNTGPDEPGGNPGTAGGQDGAAAAVPDGRGNAPPKPDPGTCLLYASVDVEFSQSNKFIGEIFQMSVVKRSGQPATWVDAASTARGSSWQPQPSCDRGLHMDGFQTRGLRRGGGFPRQA